MALVSRRVLGDAGIVKQPDLAVVVCCHDEPLVVGAVCKKRRCELRHVRTES